MPDVTLSKAVGGGATQLAPDLNYPINKQSNTPAINLTMDVSGGVLQTALSLTGKYMLSFLVMYNITNSESVKSKLTIDGEVKWDASAGYTSGIRDPLIGYGSATQPDALEFYEVKETLLFEYATTADTSIDMAYIARPIV